MPDGITSDLIIVVRKGNKTLVEPTIAGTPVNGTPPVSVGSTTSPAERAPAPPAAGDVPEFPAIHRTRDHPPPHPKAEVAPTQGTFAVYRGGVDSPLDRQAVWRYAAKAALDAPDVLAVDAFRKAIADSEKQLAKGPYALRVFIPPQSTSSDPEQNSHPHRNHSKPIQTGAT